MANPLRGVFTALVTPFMKSGKLDENALRDLIEFQISNGIDGIVPCGTTGESPTLSDNEKKTIIRLTVKHARGRAKVIAGTGSNWTEHSIQLSRFAEDAGVDGLLLVNPYYNKPTQKGLFLHFSSIADAVKIPCVVYNIKGRTSVNVETTTLIKLMNECPNIAAVKEASGDIDQIKDVIARRKPGFCVLSGDDNMTLALVRAGGDGIVSVASNIVPAEMVKMTHYALEGKYDQAKEIENKLSLLFKTLFIETNPIPIKTMLAMQGRCEEIFRLPMCELESDEHRKMVQQVVAGLAR
ncbi:MAG: 4-hydroxy-tetrahydrodipicolinate synthase [Bacteroidota bacterium]